MNKEVLKNRPELSLPLLDKKLVIAHYMTAMTYWKDETPNEDLFNPRMYSPEGKSGRLGGMNQHISMIAYYCMDEATIEESVRMEIKAALTVGIDGFQFYYPDFFDQERKDLYYKIITTFLKVADREFPGFKLTVCPSHPNARSEAENIANWGETIGRIIQDTKDLDSWLKTPDGRYIFYLWCCDGLADSANPHWIVNEKPDLIADVAVAYEKLAQEIGVPIAYIYCLREEFNGNRQLVSNVLDYFPAVWGFIPNADDQDGWEIVKDECKKRNRLYSQSVFSDFYTSKFYDKNEQFKLILNYDECEGLEVNDFWKRYIGTDLSRTFRAQLQRAVDWDVGLINIVTWNDYPEGHHLAPEINHNFGFAVLLNYFKTLWKKKEDNTGKEFAVTFFNKYPREVKPEPFDFEIRYIRGEDINEDYIEVVSYLEQPAKLFINDRDYGLVEAGLKESRIPMESGQVKVVFMRDGREVLSLLTPEAITMKPCRTDLGTYAFSTEFMTYFKEIFGDREPIYSTEYVEPQNKLGTDLHKYI